MNLYPNIVAELETQLGTKRKQTVSNVWKVFKHVILKSPLGNHENVTDCFFNSECNDLDGKRYLRIGIEYRLKYDVDKEEYEHSEDISCEFEIDDLTVQIDGSDSYSGAEHPLEIYLFEQMFSNIEEWKAYKIYKDATLHFTVSGCEI